MKRVVAMRIALLLALIGLGGCAWTFRHLFPDCGNADFSCTDVCGCQDCWRDSPKGQGCDDQIKTAPCPSYMTCQ